MGDGDSLYDKIDPGLRGCKVVVSCATQIYSLPPNCRREVSRADAIKKPIIPLLLEDTTWPPGGPMSMVFTQLLYIKFDESSQDKWTGPKFDELMMKLMDHLPVCEKPAAESAPKIPPGKGRGQTKGSSAGETRAPGKPVVALMGEGYFLLAVAHQG